MGEWERANRVLEGTEAGAEVDSEDEEIVFVGRNGTMSDEQRRTVEEELEREKLVFDSLEADHGASFGYVFPIIFRTIPLLCPNSPVNTNQPSKCN